MRSLKTNALRLTTLLLLLFVCLVFTLPSDSAHASKLPTSRVAASPTPFPCEATPPSCSNPPIVTVNSQQAPCDVCIPTPTPACNPIQFFDDYSWRTFIALVWPAQIQNNQRGVPDTTQSVGGTGPRVFETYKALWEVFHQDGSEPVAWNENEPPTRNACGQPTGA